MAGFPILKCFEFLLIFRLEALRKKSCCGEFPIGQGRDCWVKKGRSVDSESAVDFIEREGDDGKDVPKHNLVGQRF